MREQDNTFWLEDKTERDEEQRRIEQAERMAQRFLQRFQQKHAGESILEASAWLRK